MKILQIVSITLLLLVAPFSAVMSQNNATGKADEAFKYEKYSLAAELYKKAYSQVKNKVEKKRIVFQMGECARLTKNPKIAENHYRTAIKAKYSDPIVYLYLAEALRDQEKYQEAIEQYNEYVQKVPGDPRGRLGLESCKNALEWIKPDNQFKTRYEVENMGNKVNSKDMDFSPAYADKKYKTLMFTSTRKDADLPLDENTGWSFSSLYIIEQDLRNNWSKPILIDENGTINSQENNGSATFNRKFNTMYFTRCIVAKKEIHGCEIYTSERKGQIWTEPEALDIASDSLKVGHPAVTRNEKYIYFAAALPNGYGGRDIWVSERKKKNKGFDKPVNLGVNINTSGNEYYPTLRELEDGTTYLYFSSDGRGGMGSLDIYRSELVNGKWTEAINLGYPLNSSGDDFGIVFNESNKLEKVLPTREKIICDEMGFLTSNRKGGKGGTDIWEFWLPEIVFTLAGTIKDEINLQFLPNSTITLVGSDGTNLVTQTDQRGYYSFNKKQIMKNTTYTVKVAHKGYFDNKGTTTTVGLKKTQDLILNINLTPLPKEPIPLPEILYENAKWELRPQFQDSLNDLIKTMKNNPTIVVELMSHTDMNDESIKNDTLSQRRAQGVVDYLITKGIDKDRLVAKGYGENSPRTLKKDITFTKDEFKGVSFQAGVTLNEDFINIVLKTKKEKDAANQLNRRTEFRILRDDFVPKNTNDSLSRPKVKINPDDKSLDFAFSGDTIISECYLNDRTYSFYYDQKDEDLKVSLNVVMDLIKDHKLTKNDFVLADSAFDEDGLVLDGAEFTITRLRIGTYTQYDLKAKCMRNQFAPIIIGDAILNYFSTFTIDKTKKKFIFD